MHSTQNVLPHEMSQLKKENAMADDDYILNHFDQIMDAISSVFFRIDFPELCHWAAASKENVINLLTDISNQKFTLDAH